MTFLFRRLALALVLLAAAACSGKPAVVPVQGEAFKDNQPAAGALIIFHPIGVKGIDDLRPTATVDETGSFQPSTWKPNDGLPEGDYDVTVVWLEPARAGNTLIGGGERRGMVPDRLGGRYADPKKPQLRATIRKGEANKLRFDLK
jgi:hypothetical protein